MHTSSATEPIAPKDQLCVVVLLIELPILFPELAIPSIPGLAPVAGLITLQQHHLTPLKPPITTATTLLLDLPP